MDKRTVHTTAEEQEALIRPVDKEIASALRRAFSNVPAIGLSNGSMTVPTVSTMEQVFNNILSLGDALGRSLREVESLREELRRRDADIAAVRRVLGTEK